MLISRSTSSPSFSLLNVLYHFLGASLPDRASLDQAVPANQIKGFLARRGRGNLRLQRAELATDDELEKQRQRILSYNFSWLQR